MRFIFLLIFYISPFVLKARGLLDTLARNPLKVMIFVFIFMVLLIGSIVGIGYSVEKLKKRKITENRTTQLTFPVPEGPVEEGLSLPPAELVIRERGKPEVVYPLPTNREINIGRSSLDNQIVFRDDLTVSRKHARIRPEKEGYVIYDLQSKRGTLINGRKRHRHVLKNGDRIGIGKNMIIFRTIS